jgi:hypothetical protein
MRKLLIITLCLSLTGCATMHRHPTATKVVLIGGGAAVGVTIGILTRPHHCPSIINGYPYNGDPNVYGQCPNPSTYDPGGKHK